MKTFLLAFALLVFTGLYAQDYKKEWEKVMAYETDGKMKSAAGEVAKIYAKAKKDKNEAQVIKTFFFTSKYMQVLEEDAHVKIINNLRSEIKTASPATKALLESVYGEVLNQIYDAFKYKIDRRTNTDSTDTNNFLTWTAKDFKKAIKSTYDKSLENRELLYKIPLDNYKEIIQYNVMSLQTNRSLYDFLVEQYLSSPYRFDDEKAIVQKVDLQLLFGTTEAFIKFKTDTVAHEYKNRIKLYQEAEKFYALKKDTVSLYRIVLQRLNYINNLNAVIYYYGDDYEEEIELYKNTCYRNTLIELINNDSNNPFVYHAKFKLGYLYLNDADITLHPDYNSKALELYNDILTHAPKSDIAASAIMHRDGIINRSAGISLEQYVLPDKPVLALVTYKNITSVKVRIYKINVTDKNDKLFYEYIIQNKTPLFENIYNLPVKTDFFSYTTEIILPALPPGRYAVALNDNSENGTMFDVNTIQAAQITLIEQNNVNNDHIYQIADRETGKPVKDAYILIDNQKTEADKDGKIFIKPESLKKPENNTKASQSYSEKYQILAVYKNDTIRHEFYHYNYKNEVAVKEQDLPKVVSQLFLDRAVYRPGQTVYFKGILTRQATKGVETVPNVKVTVTLNGAKGDEMKSIDLITNKFGSFTGHYTLPRNVVTGNFSIMVTLDEQPQDIQNNKKNNHLFPDAVDFNPADAYFKVEEYKRPTFTVAFEPVTHNYKINETTALTGVAKSYSGAPVAGAKVAYRITRAATIIKWGYRDTNGYTDEITHGEAITDAEGKFIVNFTLEPNKSINTKSLPVFTYETHMEVTDINGETHSAKTDIKAGYHSFDLDAAISEIIKPENKNNTISLDSKNLNGQFMPVNGTITIYKIASPDKVYKKRNWDYPDIQQIPENEFKRMFPNISYKNINSDNITYSKTVFNQDVNTGKTKSINLTDFKNWPSGEYEMIFSAKDSTGIMIDKKAKFELVRNSDKYLPDSKIFAHEIVNKSYRKDGFIKLKLRTALPLLYVTVGADAKDNKFEKQITIIGGSAVIKIPVGINSYVTEIRFSYIWQNKMYNNDLNVESPEENEKLLITASTINNKLQPGSKENWTFTITGNNKLPSEVLASMYDVSLDNFMKTRWNFVSPQKNDNYNPSLSYRSMQSNTVSINFNNYRSAYNYGKYRPEHQLNTFGFNIIRSQYYVLPKPAKTVSEKQHNTGYYLTGTVNDSTGPLPGALVQILGTEVKVQTDIYGEYSIPVKADDILLFSFPGYEPTEIQITNQVKMDVSLEDGKNVLAEYSPRKHRQSQVKQKLTVTDIPVLQSLQEEVEKSNIMYAFGPTDANDTIILRGVSTINSNIEPLFIVDGIPVDEDGFRSIDPNNYESISTLKDAAAIGIYGNKGKNGVIVLTTKKGRKDMDALLNVQARKNFKETAFFYPQLTTDKKGNINFSFTTPESLTEWKLRLLAHNKKGVSGYFESLAVTQKDLMVVPNMPRFLREKDTIIISAKITNVTPDAKTGNAVLQLFDALTMQPADAAMMNTNNVKPFTLTAKGSATVTWKIAVPQGMEAVQYKVLAKAGNFTDGEENILPVLTNTMLVTESLPLWVRENSKKQYTFDNFKNNTSPTLRNHQVTLEYTSNPAWLAIQSLPYLMEYEHDCSEQVFARYYANAIATNVVNSNPKIAEVFAAWREKGKTLSKLEQNEELKSVIAAESPWLQDAQSEEERKNRIALLFDLDKMKFSLDADLQKLNDKQIASGGFPWFDGGYENEFITRHILAGLGHLKKATIDAKNAEKTNAIAKKGIPYMDARFMEHYKNDENNFAKKLRIVQPYSALHYLYTRSFYTDQYPADTLLKKAIAKYLDYSKNNWLQYSLYEKGMAALALHRFGEKEAAIKIVVSLKETAANITDSGMYWIENKAGWYWYQAPIETQALLIEAFSEITNDTKAVDEMKVWLLKNKQAKSWPTTKATTEAVYALLSKGSNWLSVKESTAIQLGDEKVIAKKLSDNEKEAGTGYIKLTWKPEEITKDMATLRIENKSGVPGYGGFYWQYFEELDKIKSAQTGIMNISKELYLKTNTATGPELKKITATNTAKTGDLVTIRLILTLTEDMEYVHLKDLRAAAFEPVDVLSKYEYKDGLGFYRSTKDAATHYFFDKINKGTYVLEYDVRVNNAGEFSNGISTLQSMYAPEFSGHSKGVRIKTE